MESYTYKVHIGGIYFDYDDQGRVIHIKDVNPYGAHTQTNLEYDNKGRLLAVIKDNKRTTYEYDDDDRLICEHQISNNDNTRDIVVVKYTYEDAYIEKTIKSRLMSHTKVLRFDYNMRIISDEAIYSDGGRVRTSYQFNEDSNTVKTETTATKEGEVIHHGTSEYPMLSDTEFKELLFKIDY